MAKRYIVDLRNLDPAKREVALKQIGGFAFLTTPIFGETGLEQVDVIWDSKDDFTSSSCFPSGCKYYEA